MNRMRQNIKIYSVILIAIYLSCCKTSRNGYSKMAQVKYDFDYMNNMTSELIKTNDTIIFLTLGGGYMRGIEHNYYSIKKDGEKTFVQRVSNFQKFRVVEINSSNFPWLYIKDNFDKFTLDTIKNYKEIKTDDGKTLYQGSASHGKTTSLNIKLGNSLHKIFLEPLVDSYNIGNINLDLIDKIKAAILTLGYEPSEQIKYKWER